MLSLYPILFTHVSHFVNHFIGRWGCLWHSPFRYFHMPKVKCIKRVIWFLDHVFAVFLLEIYGGFHLLYMLVNIFSNLISSIYYQVCWQMLQLLVWEIYQTCSIVGRGKLSIWRVVHQHKCCVSHFYFVLDLQCNGTCKNILWFIYLDECLYFHIID